MNRGDNLDNVAEGMYVPDFIPEYREDLNFKKDSKLISLYVSSFSGSLVRLKVFSDEAEDNIEVLEGRLLIDRTDKDYSPERFNLVLNNGEIRSLPYTHIRRFERNINPENIGKTRSEEKQKKIRDYHDSPNKLRRK